ncbi:MAG: trehalose-phosphatase [Acidobacteriota bacterium]
MIPSAMDSLAAIGDESEGKRVALFFDYDGTLSPIVERPDLAYMADSMRETVRNLARMCPVAVVSGRDRADVEKFVQLDSIFYAGSHGFDIAGPDGRHMQQRQGEAFVPMLRKAESELRALLEGMEGALVESKKYAFAVHYRLVSEADKPRLDEAVDEVAGRYSDLRKKGGKMVYEILPKMDWDKGKAVDWLLEALDLDHPDVLPFYLGDDLTDEDAFGALQAKGIGILVADKPQETKAKYVLRDVEEVRLFLGRLTEMLEQRAG